MQILRGPGARCITGCDRSGLVMKITKIALLILVIAVALYVLFPNLSWAEEEVASSGVRPKLQCPMIRQEESRR